MHFFVNGVGAFAHPVYFTRERITPLFHRYADPLSLGYAAPPFRKTPKAARDDPFFQESRKFEREAPLPAIGDVQKGGISQLPKGNALRGNRTWCLYP